MNIVQCTKGHFYDSEKYSCCPQCGTNISRGDYHKNSKNNSTGRISGVFVKPSDSQYEENGITSPKKAQENIAEKPNLKTEPTVVMGVTGERKKQQRTVTRQLNKFQNSLYKRILLFI